MENRMINIMVGISGAGKTTWTKKDSASIDKNTFTIISPDLERKALTGDISNQECSAQAFFNCFEQLKKAVVNPNLNVIYWDATNLSTKSLKDIIKIINDSGFDWKVRVICLEDSRDWKLCYNRVENDLNNGVDRSRSINCFNDVSGLPIIQDMSIRYIHLVDEVLDDWCKRNNVEKVNVYGRA